ncbi:hypothetical protein EGR_10835 [Echinococcus granulosus]|uniref:Uncharacterized protein n=1 Tax=Echinococcus granulosus TaxID=6210 RepID=W6TZX2_ECHGR|nr:hypothetical protein EGR_10835 [Echinococcus granulosus]EUB54303.1 hypothetical protein EGR_10835 [Echinococcus granulosus]
MGCLWATEVQINEYTNLEGEKSHCDPCCGTHPKLMSTGRRANDSINTVVEGEISFWWQKGLVPNSFSSADQCTCMHLQSTNFHQFEHSYRMCSYFDFTSHEINSTRRLSSYNNRWSSTVYAKKVVDGDPKNDLKNFHSLYAPSTYDVKEVNRRPSVCTPKFCT